MKPLVILVIVVGLLFATRAAFASCGPGPDPAGAELTEPKLVELSDSLEAILSRSGYVAIAHIESFTCRITETEPTGYTYPMYECVLSLATDSVLKATQDRLEDSTLKLRAPWASMLEHIHARQFLVHESADHPIEESILPGCFSPYDAYFLSGDKFFNQYVSRTGYLPRDSIFELRAHPHGGDTIEMIVLDSDGNPWMAFAAHSVGAYVTGREHNDTLTVESKRGEFIIFPKSMGMRRPDSPRPEVARLPKGVSIDGRIRILSAPVTPRRDRWPSVSSGIR